MLPSSDGHRVTELDQLPGRIDDLTSQVSQLRTEMRDEFSAVRGEVSAVRGEVSEVRVEISAVRGEIAERATSVEMRVLHEDVISRFALLQEGQAAPRATPKQRPRKKT